MGLGLMYMGFGFMVSRGTRANYIMIYTYMGLGFRVSTRGSLSPYMGLGFRVSRDSRLIITVYGFRV